LLILPSTTQSLFKKTISFPPTPDLRSPFLAEGLSQCWSFVKRMEEGD
jgi:hypothetical protein